MKWFPPLVLLLLLVLVLAAVVPAVANVQINTPGTACPGPDSTVFWEQASLCPQGTLLWQRPAYQFGPSTSQTCNSGLAGMVQWTSTAASPNNTLQYCNGTSWTNFAASGSGILLGSSATATNPQATGDAGTGLFSATASTVSIATAGVEAMRVTATGSVGIGTTSPTNPLSVKATSSGGGTYAIATYAANGTMNFATRDDGAIFSKKGILMGNSDAIITGSGSSVTIEPAQGVPVLVALSATYGIAMTANYFKMTNADTGSNPELSATGYDTNINIALTPKGSGNVLVTNGAVGIGTITPRSKLDVSGGVAVGSYAGTATAPSNSLIVSGGIGIATSSPRTSLDAGYNTDALVLQSGTTGQRPASPVGGMMRYNTTANTVEFYQNGGWVYPVWSSDVRLKTHIAPVKNALDIVTGMRPVFFDWDKDSPKASGMDDRRHIGFLAQELEDVLPEVVNVGADTYRRGHAIERAG